MSDDIQFSLINLTFTQLMLIYLEVLKFFSYLRQIEQCLIISWCRVQFGFISHALFMWKSYQITRITLSQHDDDEEW